MTTNSILVSLLNIKRLAENGDDRGSDAIMQLAFIATEARTAIREIELASEEQTQ